MEIRAKSITITDDAGQNHVLASAKITQLLDAVVQLQVPDTGAAMKLTARNLVDLLRQLECPLSGGAA